MLPRPIKTYSKWVVGLIPCVLEHHQNVKQSISWWPSAVSMACGANPGTIYVDFKLFQLDFLLGCLKMCCQGPPKCVHNGLSGKFSVLPRGIKMSIKHLNSGLAAQHGLGSGSGHHVCWCKAFSARFPSGQPKGLLSGPTKMCSQ